MDDMIIPVVAGLAGLILGLIISKISEKSKANKILSATKKESNSLIKQAKFWLKLFWLKLEARTRELRVIPSPQARNHGLLREAGCC